MTGEIFIYDTVVVGGGVAGLTAGIYSARAGLSSVVIERKSPGGQIILTDKVENFPGFIKISGYELASKMTEQLNKFDVKVINFNAERAELDTKIKTLYSKNKIIKARTVIVATGASPKRAGFNGEEKFAGKGVSYCVTCDGFFYKDKEVFVIGGGYSAVQEAIYLTGIVKKVIVLIRKDRFGCPKSVADKLLERRNVEIYFNTELVSIQGDEFPKSAVLKNNKTDEYYEYKTDNDKFGVFVYAGYAPNSDLLKDMVSLDENGYIIAGEDCITNLDGVFVAGDVRKKGLRQLVTAVSDGAVAAAQAEKYVNNNK